MMNLLSNEKSNLKNYTTQYSNATQRLTTNMLKQQVWHRMTILWWTEFPDLSSPLLTIYTQHFY